MAEKMGETSELIAGERILFDQVLPDYLPGDPGHPDRYICHGCHRPMRLIRLNPRVAFNVHQCEMLDEKWVLLVKTSFIRDLYKRMIEGLVVEQDFGTESEPE